MGYTIRDFSKICGVPAGRLRFFEQAGLTPSERSEKGYRLYSMQDSYRVNTFNSLVSQGFTLAEAGVRVNGVEPQEYCLALEEKIRQLETEQWLTQKKIEWDRLLVQVFSHFDEIAARPTVHELPGFCYLPGTIEEDQTPSLSVSEQISKMVSLLPASCYAGISYKDGTGGLGLIAATEDMERFHIDRAGMLEEPAGKWLVKLVKDDPGCEALAADVAVREALGNRALPEKIYIVYLMTESEAYGPWPQFLLIRLD